MRRGLSAGLVLTGIIAAIIWNGCGESEKEEGSGVVGGNVYHSQIVQPISNSVIKKGSAVAFSLAVNDYGNGNDSVFIFLDGKKIYSSEKELSAHDLSIPTDTLRMGNHEIKTVFMHSDKGREDNYLNFFVLPDKAPVQYGYTVIKKYPHDANSYTQGLEFFNGNLYEGTGREGQSLLRLININDGRPLKELRLEDRYFGEGITIMNNKIYQLTWSTHKGFVYDLATFNKVNEFSYNTQGWGLTHDDNYLIMSDGSEKLSFLDPVTFKVVKQIQVCDNNGIVNSLNELEYIDGEIWANVYMTDRIVRINPKTGEVTGSIEMRGLKDPNLPDDADYVLNGIAYDHTTKKLYVTGKLWKELCQVEIKSGI
jgi:glutaminyl-peptide cyclotransferase